MPVQKKSYRYQSRHVVISDDNNSITVCISFIHNKRMAIFTERCAISAKDSYPDSAMCVVNSSLMVYNIALPINKDANGFGKISKTVNKVRLKGKMTVVKTIKKVTKKNTV